jgi:hypothetical protein
MGIESNAQQFAANAAVEQIDTEFSREGPEAGVTSGARLAHDDQISYYAL